MNCENITLKNFCIDYAVPGYAWGKIIDVTDDYFDLDFTLGEFNIDVTDDGSAKIFDDFGGFEMISRSLVLSEIDSKTGAHVGQRYFLKLDDWEKFALLSSLYRKSKFKMLSENIIRIYAERDWSRESKHKVGNYIFLMFQEEITLISSLIIVLIYV